MISKALNIKPGQCNGCGDCETACAQKHFDVDDRAKSRIRIINWGNGESHLPMTCQQCQSAPCLAVCPNSAISRDPELDRVVINHDLCVGCKMCVTACPFGAMRFDEDRGLSFKCELCSGDPECVRVCETGALEYLETEKHNITAMRKTAIIFTGVGRKSATAQLVRT